MRPQFALAALIAAAVISPNVPAFAGASDYAFEPITAEMKKGEDITVAARLSAHADREARSSSALYCALAQRGNRTKSWLKSRGSGHQNDDNACVRPRGDQMRLCRSRATIVLVGCCSASRLAPRSSPIRLPRRPILTA